jgi:hypothetical protein
LGNTIQVRAAPEGILDAGQALQQEMIKTTRGGIYEIALGGAYNKGDKWLFGGTLGIPIMNFRSTTSFSEKDTSNNTRNGFSSFTYNDNFETGGIGVNAKLGVIYRPQDYVRIGLAVHTPSVFILNDERTTQISSNLESPSGNPESFSASSTLFTNGQAGMAEYQQRSAWRAILSGSYVFREIENVKKQKGFITADVEYVNHRSGRFASAQATENVTEDEENYYNSLNNVVKDIYKGAFNVRLGGEVKFNIIMARLGFAYYSNPYKDLGFKANRAILSGGLGYRHKGVFIDLTYAHQFSKDANFPYRLEDRANPFAATRQNLGNVMATVGFKF